MNIYVYLPFRQYSSGSTHIAANSLDEAGALARTVPISLRFSHTLAGVEATGEPRIVFDDAFED